MKWKTMDEFAQMVVDKAINEIECNGKTLREWIEIISATELGTNLAEVGTDVPDTNVGDKAQLSDKGTTFENGGEIKRWSKMDFCQWLDDAETIIEAAEGSK